MILLFSGWSPVTDTIRPSLLYRKHQVQLSCQIAQIAESKWTRSFQSPLSNSNYFFFADSVLLAFFLLCWQHVGKSLFSTVNLIWAVSYVVVVNSFAGLERLLATCCIWYTATAVSSTPYPFMKVSVVMLGCTVVEEPRKSTAIADTFQSPLIAATSWYLAILDAFISLSNLELELVRKLLHSSIATRILFDLSFYRKQRVTH